LKLAAQQRDRIATMPRNRFANIDRGITNSPSLGLGMFRRDPFRKFNP
jgi:hypothetical protein